MGRLLLCAFFISTVWVQRIHCQACTNTFFGENNPDSKKNDVDTNTGFGYQMGDTNNIIDCCGIVTSWQAYFDNVVGSRTVDFQIWRLVSGTNYNLVGENSFTVSATGEQTTTIAQANRITIKSGDIFGWWTSGADVITYKAGGGEQDNNKFFALGDLSAGTAQDWSTATNQNGRSYAVRVDVSANNSPTFSNIPTTVTISNAVTSGTNVITVTVSDIDTDDVSSLTIAMATNSYFSFDTATAIVTTSTAQSAAAVRTAIFEVTDQCSNTATATLTVSITNDPPTIHNLPAAVTISEDLTADTLHLTINVTDTATGTTLTCSLASGGDSKFEVRFISTSVYGIYSIASPAFDYNTTNSYALSIQCSDGSLTDTDTFTVYLTKNAAPVMTNLQNSTSIPSNTSIATTVFTVITTDAENNNLNYTMTCNPSTCPFTIFDSGEVRLNRDISNETVVGYDLFITVTDGKNTVGPLTLTVTISDINDPVTMSNLPLGSSLTVSENTALGTTVYTVSYSDSDTSQAHTFTMTSSPSVGSTYFSIDSSTGVITTSGTVLNYEALTNTSFTFSVTVSDPITSDTQPLTIDVINVNEAPSFSQSTYTLSATEGTAGTIIGTPNLGVTDPDSGDTTSVSMDCGSNSGYFYMNSSTGSISFQSDYDLDTGSRPTSVSCNLTATDSGGLTDMATLLITITDINDNTPVFLPASYSFFISYYAATGVTVGNVSASDADNGTFGVITMSLNQTHLSAEYFTIDNSGVITIKQSPDGSTLGYATSVTITAIATDSGGLSDTATVVIVISDTTTTVATTTTDRHRQFFEDTKNIPWFIACILTLVAIAGYLFWLMYTCKGENSCENWFRRVRQRNRNNRRYRRPRTPDRLSTIDRASLPKHSNSVGLFSIRKPPPPIESQAWRSRRF